MSHCLHKIKTEFVRIPCNPDYIEFLLDYFPDSQENFIYLETEEFKRKMETDYKAEAKKFKEEIEATLKALKENGDSLWLLEM